MTDRSCVRLVAVVLGLWWIATAAAVARAQTYGIDFRNTLMPASGGMAGTSVAAPQDFISAINANPAGLTQFDGTHFTLGGAFAEATANLTQSAPLPLLGVTPFSAKSSTPGAIVPAIGVAQEVTGLPLPTTSSGPATPTARFLVLVALWCARQTTATAGDAAAATTTNADQRAGAGDDHHAARAPARGMQVPLQLADQQHWKADPAAVPAPAHTHRPTVWLHRLVHAHLRYMRWGAGRTPPVCAWRR